MEEAGVDEVPDRLSEVERHPALVLVHSHDAIAEVLVLADDVGVAVVVPLICSSMPKPSDIA